ncbi:heavy metal-associated isoprenylated plant protein 7-like [Rhodamnia argentea]|uniref:Heavy metal-associated isoprenylated plant protein 7-like n=1 Tax=Rhodamnia argentea TaxID=178133 RepID=A0A8B8Q5G9_9MYRT|nr:heavy metal-associated isoprenylated plant protein 7-like [Rhodamnia argentea]
MGEEEKKAQAQEEANKTEEAKPDKKEEEKKPEKAADEGKKAEESKDGKESNDPPPPPPEIVLKVYMHCEGCARKVRRSLNGFDGVEEVTTDCRTHKVVVKGEKADPLKVLERVQKKSHRQVELLSPIPKPPAPEDKKPEEKEAPKPEEKKEEPPQVITVVLSVHMHCEACAQTIKKRILRMKGVESAEPDLKSSQVTVKGVFEPPKLVEYVHKRTGRHAAIVKQEPEKKEEEKAKDAKEEKKAGDGGGGDKKSEGESKEKKEGDASAEAKAEATEENKVVEMMKNEYYYNQFYSAPRNVPVDHLYAPPPPYNYNHQPFVAAPYNPYPPEIFSDENPNACSVM